MAVQRGPRMRTVDEEMAYHDAMAELMRQRGYPGLARSHQLAFGLYLPDDARAANLARCRNRE